MADFLMGDLGDVPKLWRVIGENGIAGATGGADAEVHVRHLKGETVKLSKPTVSNKTSVLVDDLGQSKDGLENGNLNGENGENKHDSEPFFSGGGLTWHFFIAGSKV